MGNFGRNLALWAIIILLLLALFNLFQGPSGPGVQAEVPYSTFIAEVEQGIVRDVTIEGQNITGTRFDGTMFKTFAP
ncbi:MAG: cell division protein FtsH, partial [Alphaproteobacteria bacterium]